MVPFSGKAKGFPANGFVSRPSEMFSAQWGCLILTQRKGEIEEKLKFAKI